MSKQLKLKLVSFLCLLSGRGLPAPEAAALFVFSGYGGVWTGRAAQSPLQECPFWTGLWNAHPVGGSKSDYVGWSNFLGIRVLAQETLKATQGESSNHTAD